MARCWIVFCLVCSMVCWTYAAKPVVDPNTCRNGCQTDDQCPTNGHCSLPNPGGTCKCICDDGFKKQGAKCNPIKGYSTTTTSTTTTTAPSTTTETTTTEASTTSTTTQATTTTTTATTTTGTTAQPATPPAADPVNCADYDCSAAPVESKPDDPLQVRSAVVDTGSNPSCKRELAIAPRKCNMKGGGSCYGAYCLTVDSGNDYCVCPPYRVDRQCAVDKPGSCSKATGQLATGVTPLEGKRLRNPSDKDNGSIYGRHFAATMADCIKLCQWTGGPCRSVNFGPIQGSSTKLCEMLSIGATEKNLLAKWLETADGWQYALVGQAN